MLYKHVQLVGPKMANIYHIRSWNAGSIRPSQKWVTVSMSSAGHAHPTSFIVNSALDKNPFENCSLSSLQSIRFSFGQALAACKGRDHRSYAQVVATQWDSPIKKTINGLPRVKSTQYTNTKVNTSTQYFGSKHKFDGSKHWVTTKYFKNKGKYCSISDPVDSNQLNVNNNVGALDSIVNFHACPNHQ